MKNRVFPGLVMVLGILLSSCVAQHKMSYFRNIDKVSLDSINKHYEAAKEPVIRKGDKLVILVSALDPEAVAPFNLPVVSTLEPNMLEATSTGKVQYYTVDNEGDIMFPVIGKVHLDGLSKSEAIDLLQQKIGVLVNNPLVTLNFVGYSVTVLGEVKTPGRYVVSPERTSVLDALAQAGDLTIYGKRDNVLLTREKDGKLEFVRLNLNSSDIFMSPYFYLQQNDVLYVEPTNARAISSQNLPLYLSVVTTLASMATVIVSVVNTTKTVVE